MKRVLVLCAGVLLAGCLGEPQAKVCDGAECVDATPDVGVADGAPDAGPDADAAPGDAGPDPDLAVDASAHDAGYDAAVDAGPDPDGAVDARPDAGECMPGTSIPCGTDEGSCVIGQAFCNAAGQYEACLGAVDPAPEVCNGLDDNCDGETDEGCDCVDDETQACGSAVGACSTGTQTCVRGAWGPCEGAVDGTPEICDGQDNDCNGTDDDLPQLGQVCAVSQGACRAEGALICAAGDIGAPTCDAVAGEPIAELCNVIDDDCDGNLDEGIRPSFSQLDTGIIRRDLPPEVVPSGEFHALTWITDGQLGYGLALADEWEVLPAIIGNYDGNDTIAVAHAMDRAPVYEGALVGVGYDGLGSGVDLFTVSTGGVLTHGWSVGADDAAYDLDVAAQGAAAAIVYRVPDRAGGADSLMFEYFSGEDARGVPLEIRELGRRYHSPRLISTGARFAMLWMSSIGRVDTGRIHFRTVEPEPGQGGRRVDLCPNESCGNPDIAWMPTQGQLIVAWDALDDGGLARQIYVAILDAGGAVVDGPFVMPGAGGARPRVMPRVVPGRATTEIAIVWEETNGDATSLEIGWLLNSRLEWRVAPSTNRVTPSHSGESAAGVAFSPDGEGYGVAFTMGGERLPSNLRFLTGNFGCPTAP